MFWKFSYPTSQITTILEKPDVTLEEILNEDDVLQECKSNNEKLVSFLTQYENIMQLVNNIVTLPQANDMNEQTRFKYSTISCELLTCDVSSISDALLLNSEPINILYSFLHNDSPLNPLLASYFAKILGSLITRKTDVLLGYLQSKTDFVELILKHINTSAIMDILLRLLTTIDSADLKKRVLTWLDEIHLIESLIDLFSPSNTDDVHSNVSQLLCDIIRITREQIFSNREVQRESAAYGSQGDYAFQSTLPNTFDYNGKPNGTQELLLTNPLLDSIEKPENIEKLLGHMFDTDKSSNSALQYGIDVLLTLLEPKTSTIEFIVEYKNQEADRLLKEQERLLIASRGIKNVCEVCVSRLELFDRLLNGKPAIEMANMTFGTLRPPLGLMRLNIVKLIVKLMLTNESKIGEEMRRIGTLNKILNLAFEYKWNNFLHAQMMNLLSHILGPKTQSDTIVDDDLQNKLVDHLFTDCRLMDKILNAWFSYFESSLYDRKNGKQSQNAGYIGHLTQICNLITKCTQEGKFVDYLKSYFEQETNKEMGDQWKDIEDTKLQEINRKNTQDLVRNPLSSSIDSNTESDTNVEFPSENDMHKKFADFNKDMTPSFVDSFGMSESNLTSIGIKSNDGFPKLQNISFQSFQMDTNDENAQLFDQICSQRDSMKEATGDGCNTSGNTNDEDVWIQREIKFENEVHEQQQKHQNDFQMDSNRNDDVNCSLKNKKEYFKNLSSSSSDTSSSSSDSEDEVVDKTLTIANEHQQIENNTQIEEMDYQNSTTDENDSNSNWADFTAFKTESIQEGGEEQEHSEVMNKILESKREGEAWANFDSFNNLANERCSSPNDCSAPMDTSYTLNDRSKTYLTETIQVDESVIVNKINSSHEEVQQDIKIGNE